MRALLLLLAASVWSVAASPFAARVILSIGPAVTTADSVAVSSGLARGFSGTPAPMDSTRGVHFFIFGVLTHQGPWSMLQAHLIDVESGATIQVRRLVARDRDIPDSAYAMGRGFAEYAASLPRVISRGDTARRSQLPVACPAGFLPDSAHTPSPARMSMAEAVACGRALNTKR